MPLALRWVGALAVLHLILVVPDHPDAFGLHALLRVPVELPIVVLVLLLCPRSRWPLLRATLVAGLGLIVLARAADLAAYASLGRPFNWLLDLHLAGASLDLLVGALGLARTAALVAMAAIAWLVLLLLAWWATGVLRAGEGMRRPAAAGAVVAAMVVGGIHLGAAAGPAPALTTADASRSVLEHLRSLRAGLADRAGFRAELAEDRFARIPSARLLARLRDIDVLFLFVESYGRSSLENPRFAPVVDDALADFEQAAAAAGFGARSAWLTSPIQGGQSWLAHATLLAGLRIDDQRRHQSLLLSDRPTLVGDFGRAGWRTIAVMPAVDRPWPEARFFGFDRVYDAHALGYAGEPFNWVTMPDQFTLAALRSLELDRSGRPTIMASVALISSHAPWTPIPPVLAWEDIGDGSVFTAYARAGDPPDVVWRDPDRIRAQYLRSIDYVLRTLTSFVRSYGRDDVLIVVVGDHQPARVVTGEVASFDVPVHFLSRNEAVLGHIDDWGWSHGMRPGAEAPVWPMEQLRERFLAAFTPPAAPSDP